MVTPLSPNLAHSIDGLLLLQMYMGGQSKLTTQQAHKTDCNIVWMATLVLLHSSLCPLHLLRIIMFEVITG